MHLTPALPELDGERPPSVLPCPWLAAGWRQVSGTLWAPGPARQLQATEPIAQHGAEATSHVPVHVPGSAPGVWVHNLPPAAACTLWLPESVGAHPSELQGLPVLVRDHHVLSKGCISEFLPLFTASSLRVDLPVGICARSGVSLYLPYTAQVMNVGPVHQHVFHRLPSSMQGFCGFFLTTFIR